MTDIFYQEVRKWKSAYERKSKTIFIFGVKLNQSISKISAPKLITYISITNIILYQDLPWEVTCMSLSFVLWRKYQYHRRKFDLTGFDIVRKMNLCELPLPPTTPVNHILCYFSQRSSSIKYF